MQYCIARNKRYGAGRPGSWATCNFKASANIWARRSRQTNRYKCRRRDVGRHGRPMRRKIDTSTNSEMGIACAEPAVAETPLIPVYRRHGERRIESLRQLEGQLIASLSPIRLVFGVERPGTPAEAIAGLPPSRNLKRYARRGRASVWSVVIAATTDLRRRRSSPTARAASLAGIDASSVNIAFILRRRARGTRFELQSSARSLIDVAPTAGRCRHPSSRPHCESKPSRSRQKLFLIIASRLAAIYARWPSAGARLLHSVAARAGVGACGRHR